MTAELAVMTPWSLICWSVAVVVVVLCGVLCVVVVVAAMRFLDVMLS